MKNHRRAITIITFVLFVISAVTGIIMFAAPRPPHVPGQEAMNAAKGAAEAGGISAMLIIKKGHEYLSLVLAFMALFHIGNNWKVLKGYMIGK